MSESNIPAVWNPNQGIYIPNEALGEIDRVVDYNKRLYPREVRDITKAFNNELFDMAVEFTWTRTINILKERVLSFGKDFVLEMLGRTDETSLEISEVEAIRLAADLGIINETAKIRFMHVFELIQHYSSRKQAAEEGLNKLDALNNISLCIRYILGIEEDGFQIAYSDFRDRLKSEKLDEDDNVVQTLILAPYFYKRTTVRTLLNLLKKTKSGEQENVFANMTLIVPAIWEDLLSDDRYPIGFSYSEAVNEGNQRIVGALKSVLLKVKGFDYVPEDLRSRSFISAANKLLEVHFGMDNFYREPAAANTLLSMGKTYPKPAVGAILTATLACKLGNRYGNSHDAQWPLDQILINITKEQWGYYFNYIFPGDETIIYKLMEDSHRILAHWSTLITKYKLDELNFSDTKIGNLITAGKNGNTGKVVSGARKLYAKLRGEDD